MATKCNVFPLLSLFECSLFILKNLWNFPNISLAYVSFWKSWLYCNLPQKQSGSMKTLKAQISPNIHVHNESVNAQNCAVKRTQVFIISVFCCINCPSCWRKWCSRHWWCVCLQTFRRASVQRVSGVPSVPSRRSAGLSSGRAEEGFRERTPVWLVSDGVQDVK